MIVKSMDLSRRFNEIIQMDKTVYAIDVRDRIIDY